MTDKTLTLPVAIVLAGALIGAGLLFGLRGRPAEPAAVALSTSTSALPAGEAPAARAAPTLALPAPPSKTKLVEQATAALEGQRAMLVKTCWEPAVKAGPKPPSSRYVFNFTFGADGTQIMRGIAASRVPETTDVSSCLNQSMPGLKIPPPGVSSYVEVPFSLP